MCRYLAQFECEGTSKGSAIKMSLISITYYFRFWFLKFFFLKQPEPFYENMIKPYHSCSRFGALLYFRSIDRHM